MSNDQIIRSSKPHEVTIPEGSNSARSIRNKLGHREVEQERQEKISTDKQFTDNTVKAESDAVSDRLVQVEQAGAPGTQQTVPVQNDAAGENRVNINDTRDGASNRVKVQSSDLQDSRVALPQGGGGAENIAQVPTDRLDSNRVAVPTDTQEDHRVAVPTDSQQDHRVGLPSDSHSDNRAQLPTDASTDHRVSIPAGDRNDQRATHEDEALRDSHARLDGSTPSTHAVAVTSDSIQDSFAQTPNMTNTASPPVKVDGHGITDPARVVVEESPGHLANVHVPHAEPEVAPQEFVQEVAPPEPVMAAPVAVATANVQAEPAQVTATLADKKAEEFRGRVVKLRDEVDQLNRRLDDIKK